MTVKQMNTTLFSPKVNLGLIFHLTAYILCLNLTNIIFLSQEYIELSSTPQF